MDPLERVHRVVSEDDGRPGTRQESGTKRSCNGVERGEKTQGDKNEIDAG